MAHALAPEDEEVKEMTVVEKVVDALTTAYCSEEYAKHIFYRMVEATCQSTPRFDLVDIGIVCRVLGISHPPRTPWQVKLASVQAWYKVTQRLAGESPALQAHREKNIQGLRAAPVLDAEVRRLLSP